MNIRILVISAIIWSIGITGFAQATYEAGILPTVNLSKKIGKGYGLNFQLGSRDAFIAGAFSGKPTIAYEHILTDFALIGSKKVGVNNKVAFGYQFRIRDEKIVHRLIQQFTIINAHLNGIRLAHRFAADETFTADKDMVLRLRYRLTTEFALNGESVDPKEWYVKVNNEYLNAFEGDEYDLELRLVPLLGYVFSDNNKIETGIDYRLSSFIEGKAKNKFWLSIGWYIKI
ncbi:DUF2490 domain-containing protein [Aquimarina rhabdastrellae]